MARVLEGRKKEIWEMATLMADEENPTDREIARELVHAKAVVDGIDEVLGWVTGKNPRPVARPTFKEKLARWKQMAEEIDNEGN